MRGLACLVAALALVLGLPEAPAEGSGKRRRTQPRPAELAWPLDIDDGLSASFGELRGDRLHTGIDLRTRGSTGFAVRAVGQGRVLRLKEEWRGYGLALYLGLAGDRIAVYGHLDRLAPALASKLVAARRARGSRWAGDVDLGAGIPVKRGELIAWSGESGAGLPHLHFELREGMGRPIDPFLGGLPRPRDAMPPVVDKLIVEPAVRGALVNGKPVPLVVPLVQGEGGYRTPAAIAVAGPVHLLLEAYDRLGSESRTGLGGLRTLVDGREIYRLEFSAIPFGQHQSSGTVLDLSRSHLGPTFYTYRLTGLEGSDLSFQHGARGALSFAPGAHRIEIQLADVGLAAGAGTSVEARLEASSAGSGSELPEPAPGSVLEISPGQSSELELGSFRLQVPAGSAWAALQLSARAIESAALPEGLVALAPAIALAPDAHPFRRPITVSFALPSPGGRAGVYRLDEVTGEWGIEELGTRAEIRRLGTVALLDDRVAPVIESLAVEAGRLRVRVHDLGSGIPERGVSIDVDEQRLEELYDPDRGEVTAPLELAPGDHVFRVRASDRAGNYNEMRERRKLE